MDLYSVPRNGAARLPDHSASNSAFDIRISSDDHLITYGIAFSDINAEDAFMTGVHLIEAAVQCKNIVSGRGFFHSDAIKFIAREPNSGKRILDFNSVAGYIIALTVYDLNNIFRGREAVVDLELNIVGLAVLDKRDRTGGDVYPLNGITFIEDEVCRPSRRNESRMNESDACRKPQRQVAKSLMPNIS